MFFYEAHYNLKIDIQPVLYFSVDHDLFLGKLDKLILINNVSFRSDLVGSSCDSLALI